MKSVANKPKEPVQVRDIAPATPADLEPTKTESAEPEFSELESGDADAEMNREISAALDAILAHAFTLDQDPSLAYKWPALPPRRSRQ
jgi:hypothetical protein